MTATYELITSSTVGSGGVSSVTFSSIPQTYTDLLIVTSTRNTGGSTGTGINVALNGSTTPTGKILYGDGSSATSANNNSSMISNDNNLTASAFANASLYIPNYAGSNAKSASGDSVNEANQAGVYAVLYANIWSSFTSAITSLQFTLANGANFMQYSTFYLYGIKNS